VLVVAALPILAQRINASDSIKERTASGMLIQDPEAPASFFRKAGFFARALRWDITRRRCG
jgi:hypothetical protein